jgi:hypothetical protein
MAANGVVGGGLLGRRFEPSRGHVTETAPTDRRVDRRSRLPASVAGAPRAWAARPSRRRPLRLARHVAYPATGAGWDERDQVAVEGAVGAGGAPVHAVAPAEVGEEGGPAAELGGDPDSASTWTGSMRGSVRGVRTSGTSWRGRCRLAGAASLSTPTAALGGSRNRHGCEALATTRSHAVSIPAAAVADRPCRVPCTVRGTAAAPHQVLNEGLQVLSGHAVTGTACLGGISGVTGP